MRRLPPIIHWNRSSTILTSGFILIIFLIVYIWWPLADEVLSYIDWKGPWWLYMDWLLIGIFLFMSLTIVVRADLRRDGLILLVASIGGTRDRILGYPNQSLVLLHQRTTSTLDHPRLAHSTNWHPQ